MTFRGFFLCLMITVGLATVVVEAGDHTGIALPTVDVTGTVWARNVFRVESQPKAEVNLALTADGTVSVYLNGQRLTRNYTVARSQLVWNVSSLLRTGQNCLAVATATSDKTAVLRVTFSPELGMKIDAGQWKSSAAAPPVGWQQTDFNDRDWAKLPPSNVAASSDFKVVRLNWKNRGAKPRWSDDRLKLFDNDHLVMIGGTFIERAQAFGHLESMMSSRVEATGVTFRNLGWSADTVFAESRGLFDSPEKGYERLVEHIRAEEPDVVLVCYGQNEAMTFTANAAAVNTFQKQLSKLVSDLNAGGAEVVLVSPHPLLPAVAPLPNPTSWNSRIGVYVQAIRDIAQDQQVGFVDLFTDFDAQLAAIQASHYHSPMLGTLDEHADLKTSQSRLWTDNGMHWNDAGYKVVAQLLAQRLWRIPHPPPSIQVNVVDQMVSAESGTIRNVAWNPSPEAVVTFDYLPQVVTPQPLRVSLRGSPDMADVSVASNRPSAAPHFFDRVHPTWPDASETWHFVRLSAMSYDTLRDLTVAKNKLYFHRWRPQNITYLFGFRKHEQGNNASEIAQYDPLIDQLEAKIDSARLPQWETLTVFNAQ